MIGSLGKLAFPNFIVARLHNIIDESSSSLVLGSTNLCLLTDQCSKFIQFDRWAEARVPLKWAMPQTSSPKVTRMRFAEGGNAYLQLSQGLQCVSSAYQCCHGYGLHDPRVSESSSVWMAWRWKKRNYFFFLINHMLFCNYFFSSLKFSSVYWNIQKHTIILLSLTQSVYPSK